MNDNPPPCKPTGPDRRWLNLLALLSIVAISATVFAVCGETGLSAVGTVSGSLFAVWHHSRH